jgi:aminopeptidase N
MTLYFERHDGQAVTCDDFAQAIADANPRSELARSCRSSSAGTAQAGTPRVTRAAATTRRAHLHADARAELPAHAGPAGGQAALRDPAGAWACCRRRPAAAAAARRRSGARRGTERVLVLDQASSFFTFVNVDAEPVPSLLRGFSAPVILDDDLADADLLVLLQHDTDPFNRWEAGQRLALNAPARGRATASAPRCSSTMRSSTRCARAAPPDARRRLQGTGAHAAVETYIAEQLDVVDPQRIHAAREAMRAAAGAGLRATGNGPSRRTRSSGGYSPDPVSSGRRALANLALGMLCLRRRAPGGDVVWPGRAYQRFKDAGNMTDRFNALARWCVARRAGRAGAAALPRAVQGRSAGHRQVVRAAGRAPETDGRVFARAKQLLKHPDFSLKNPNRARSLICSAVHAATRPRSTAPMRPAMCSGPTA